MHKLKSFNKAEIATKILASATVTAVAVLMIMLIFEFREVNRLDDFGLEIFKYIILDLKYFVTDIIIWFFMPIQIAMFPIAVLFNRERKKLPVMIYMFITATFALNNVICMIEPYYYVTTLDTVYLSADILCTVSAILILFKSESTIVKIISGLLQLPCIIVNLISCVQFFDLFSLGKEKVAIKFRNDVVYIVICLFLACSYMVTLLLLNTGAFV